MAFGEEAISVQRVGGASGNGYEAAGSTRKDYTGYEKDAETGLEYAQARYYNPTHGRFTSVDPLTASATIRNPQTLNRYSYALNSPYKFTDPLGLLSEYTTGACGNRCLNSDPNGGGGWSSDYYSGQLNGPQEQMIKEFIGLFGQAAWDALVTGEKTSAKKENKPTPSTNVAPPPAPAGSSGSSSNQGDGPCTGVEGFSTAIGGRSAEELNDASLTVFGEIPAVLPPDLNNLWEEAWIVASVIFNRADDVKNGTQGSNPFGASGSLTDVVKAPSQFAGYQKGLSDVKRGVTRANEMYEGQRNCIRLFYAIEAVRVVANGAHRAPYRFFVSNFRGTRELRPGEHRSGGNDYSTKPISIH